MTTESFDPKRAPTIEEDFVEVVIPLEIVEAATMDRGTDQDHDQECTLMMGAAAAAGGCIGCLLCGPWMACIAGAGAAYGTTRQSPAGDCTRGMGNIALSCRAKAIDVNEKHQVVEKSKTAAFVCWERCKDISERHRMVERTKGCAASSWEGMKNANREYRISDRTIEGIGIACNYVNDKIIGEVSPQPATVAPSFTVASSASAVDDVAIHQQTEQGESRKPAPRDTKKGAYVALKSDAGES